MKRISCSGFTLIEILVVVAIMAMMMGLSLNFFGGTARGRIKSETSQLMGTIQFAYNDAASRNGTNRIVFNLEDQFYTVESTEGPFLIESSKDLQSKSLFKKDKEKSKEEKKGDEESGDEIEGGEPEAFSEIDDVVVKKVKLGEVLKIRDVYTAHQEEPITEGLAYLYFFPNGLTEIAVIHLSDLEEEINYSIIVNPITGRSRVVPEYVDYENLFED